MFGIHTFLDFKGVMRAKIIEENLIKEHLKNLVEFLKMEAHGEPVLQRFGVENVYGYTAVQLITTSHIIGHFNESTNDAYIDVFSCREYKPFEVFHFCKQWFKPNLAKIKHFER